MAALSPHNSVSATEQSSTPAPDTNNGTAIQVSSSIFTGGGLTSAHPKQQLLLLSQGGLATASSLQPLNLFSAKQLQEKEEAMKRRELLARQPSYCKILNELKEAESSGSEDSIGIDDKTLAMKGEQVDLVENSSQPTTLVISGQAYQIVSPSDLGLATSGNSSTQLGASASPSVFIQAASPSASVGGKIGGSIVGTSSSFNTPVPAEEQKRKREIRLAKNREAARECRNKKKEYIKCLENRVAVLENQNKALIEELKSLKELYKSQT